MSLQNMPFGDFFSFLLGRKPEEKKKDEPIHTENKTGEEKDKDEKEPPIILKRQ